MRAASMTAERSRTRRHAGHQQPRGGRMRRTRCAGRSRISRGKCWTRRTLSAPCNTASRRASCSTSPHVERPAPCESKLLDQLRLELGNVIGAELAQENAREEQGHVRTSFADGIRPHSVTPFKRANRSARNSWRLTASNSELLPGHDHAGHRLGPGRPRRAAGLPRVARAHAAAWPERRAARSDTSSSKAMSPPSALRKNPRLARSAPIASPRR